MYYNFNNWQCCIDLFEKNGQKFKKKKKKIYSCGSLEEGKLNGSIQFIFPVKQVLLLTFVFHTEG